MREAICGSTKNGKLTSASNDPKFESANKRYGIPDPERRTYHACNNGLVEDSRKYGKPIVAPSKIRMRNVGSPACVGRHMGFGKIGSRKQLAPSSPTCSII